MPYMTSIRISLGGDILSTVVILGRKRVERPDKAFGAYQGYCIVLGTARRRLNPLLSPVYTKDASLLYNNSISIPSKNTSILLSIRSRQASLALALGLALALARIRNNLFVPKPFCKFRASDRPWRTKKKLSSKESEHQAQSKTYQHRLRNPPQVVIVVFLAHVAHYHTTRTDKIYT